MKKQKSSIRDINRIEEACERAAENQNNSWNHGSKFRGMTYEDGVRDALDWVCKNTDEDPTE